MTNKFLSHFVDRVAIVFPEVAKAFPANKVVVTGNPRAQQVAGLKPNDRLRDFGLDPHIRTLLAFGGSRGAPRINDAVVAALPIWAKADFQVLFATGRTHDTKSTCRRKSLQQVLFCAFVVLRNVTYSCTYPDSSFGNHRW